MVLAGFILFNVAFLLAAAVSKIYLLLLTAIAGKTGAPPATYFIWHYFYILTVLLISWFVFKSRLSDLIKASYLTMPLMVVLVETGVNLNRFPAFKYALGFLIIAAVTFYLYKKKSPWIYYAAVIFDALAVLFIILSGMDI